MKAGRSFVTPPSTGAVSGNLPDDVQAGNQPFWFASNEDFSCDGLGCSLL